MSPSDNPIVSLLREKFGGLDFTPEPLLACDDKQNEQTCVRVPPDRLVDVMTFLRTDERALFEQLADLTAVDYADFQGARDRFAVVYALLSITHGHRLWVKCFVNDPSPEVPSVTGIWKGANWLEREVWDLFGIKFAEHPDLRRIMTWEGFEAHPLRKDYPLRGRGERENFEVVTRDSA